MKSVPSTGWNHLHPLQQPKPSDTPPLIQALLDYDKQQRRRFHVPAHAGFQIIPPEWDLLQDPYRYDLTEVEGLDVLSEPSECLAEAQAKVAGIFNVSHSFFLLNGASVGLMAAMLAIIKPGDKVLLPRNVHRSVLSGLILTGAQPIWILPERLADWGLWGAVQPEAVAEQLQQHPDVKALLITSPTYEGIGSDVHALSDICRRANVYFVVDEAHGSLWPFSEELPNSACHLNCDAVIHSLHKTGGSLTQSALAHLPKGSRIEASLFQQALNTLQTTSPSYLLMANLEAACHTLVSSEGNRRIAELLVQVRKVRQTLNKSLKHYRLFKSDDRIWDPCKLYLMNPTVSGEDWGPRLEVDERLAYESASPEGVLYLAGLGLELDDFTFFEQVLRADDVRQVERNPSESAIPKIENPAILLPQIAMSPREAFFASGELVSTENSMGRIAKETIVHCPPGIPVLLPGEKITMAHWSYLPSQVTCVI